LVVAVATLTGLIVPARAALEHPQNVILIGWDAAQREHVEQCLARKELPNLQRLIDQGTYVKIDIEGTTDTKAGWTQILTGYYPEVTGVYSNGRFQPVPKGLSLFERLENNFGADKFVTVAVIGKKGHCGEVDPPKKVQISDEEAAALKAAPKPGKKKRDQADNQENAARPRRNARQAAKKMEPGGRIVEENGVKYLVVPGKPYMNMSKACDVWTYGLMMDEKVGTEAIRLLDKYKDQPFFFFVHFAEVDHKGHQKGENSKEYNDALISNDKWTGRIIDRLKELKLYDNTLVYVTADHGFDEGKTGHRNAPRVFLATNDKGVLRNGDRADITPTILDRFGLDLNKLQRKAVTATRPSETDPPLAGHSLVRPLEKADKE
jgi:hypothetical protein